MMPSFTPRIIAGLIGIALIVALVIFGPAACSKIRSLQAQSRMNQEQGAAFTNSATDAVETTGAVGARDARSEELTDENKRDIMAADGAGDKINPALNRAGRVALCKRVAYQNDPQCKGMAP